MYYSSGLILFAHFTRALCPDFEVVTLPKPPATPKTDAAFNRHAAVAIPWVRPGGSTHLFQKLGVLSRTTQHIPAHRTGDPRVSTGGSLGESLGFHLLDHRMPLLCRQAFFSRNSRMASFASNASANKRFRFAFSISSVFSVWRLPLASRRICAASDSTSLG